MAEAGELLQSYVRAQLARAAHCLSQRGSHAHSGVHQARKSMRRVRAGIALGGLDRDGAGRELDRSLATICRSLSTLRDAHARVGVLDALLRDDAGDHEQNLLRQARRAALDDRVVAMREARAADPEFRQLRHDLEALVAPIDALPWSTIDAQTINAAIAHSLKRALKAQARALDDGDAEDWHRWRRRRRRLSQQHTALQACGMTSDGLDDAERAITHLLGESQDLHVLVRHFSGHRALGKTERRALSALFDARRTSKTSEIRERSNPPTL